ncbi:hypothetical protein D3C71_2224360 [compost metagenome]|jgi:hypothetical protein
MAGVTFQILAINVLIHAFLFDDEHLGAQLQNGVQLFLTQVAVVFANPVNCHFHTP